MNSGLILFAHGARDPAWAAPFEAIATLVRAREPQVAVRLAYLEFMSPTLEQAGTALVQAGCARIVVRPMFLGTGGHVRRDLPSKLQALRAAHEGIEFVLQEAIGEDAAVHAVMAEVIAATVSPAAAVPGGAA